MLHNGILYEILYALAARNGREKALFGDCAGAAREAFAHSRAGDAFPELWFELPLIGDPWFDLHVLAARKDLDPNKEYEAGVTGGYPEVFSWFANQGNLVRQLALSYDVSRGAIDTPAVQLLVSNRNLKVVDDFLTVAGRADAVDAYNIFVQRIPERWFACYTGVFPGRLGDKVRVECIPDKDLQRMYVQDASLLEAHMRQTGLDMPLDTLVPYSSKLADTPFRIEFQFDVLPDGSAAPTVGVSLRFDCPPGSEEWRAFEVDGPAGELMGLVESWGLADGRWRLLADTAFAKQASKGDEAVVGFCYPAFLKVRWCDGEPLDAKAYLIAGVESAS